MILYLNDRRLSVTTWASCKEIQCNSDGTDGEKGVVVVVGLIKGHLMVTDHWSLYEWKDRMLKMPSGMLQWCV